MRREHVRRKPRHLPMAVFWSLGTAFETMKLCALTRPFGCLCSSIAVCSARLNSSRRGWQRSKLNFHMASKILHQEGKLFHFARTLMRRVSSVTDRQISADTLSDSSPRFPNQVRDAAVDCRPPASPSWAACTDTGGLAQTGGESAVAAPRACRPNSRRKRPRGQQCCDDA